MSIHSTGLGHDAPLVVSPKRACQLLDVKPTKLYSVLKELDSYLDGGARKITMASIHAYIARKLDEKRMRSVPGTPKEDVQPSAG